MDQIDPFSQSVRLVLMPSGEQLCTVSGSHR